MESSLTSFISNKASKLSPPGRLRFKHSRNKFPLTNVGISVHASHQPVLLHTALPVCADGMNRWQRLQVSRLEGRASRNGPNVYIRPPDPLLWTDSAARKANTSRVFLVISHGSSELYFSILSVRIYLESSFMSTWCFEFFAKHLSNLRRR